MEQMYVATARLLRVGSLIACLIVVASFAMLALDQVNGASQQQQTEIATGGAWRAPATVAPHHSGLRKAIDGADKSIASPFQSVTTGASSQWVVHGAQTFLVLLVFGFGLGYLARIIRVHA